MPLTKAGMPKLKNATGKTKRRSGVSVRSDSQAITDAISTDRIALPVAKMSVFLKALSAERLSKTVR